VDGGAADLLAGAEWTVTDLDGQPLPAEAGVTIGFAADGGISGRSGCNRYAGRAELSDGGLRIGPLALTRMACPEPAMQIEAAMMAALAAVERFEIAADGTLVLHGAAAELLRARR
jgi:heat shock protein HslJ